MVSKISQPQLADARESLQTLNTLQEKLEREIVTVSIDLVKMSAINPESPEKLYKLSCIGKGLFDIQNEIHDDAEKYRKRVIKILGKEGFASNSPAKGAIHTAKEILKNLASTGSKRAREDLEGSNLRKFFKDPAEEASCMGWKATTGVQCMGWKATGNLQHIEEKRAEVKSITSTLSATGFVERSIKRMSLLLTGPRES